jgi:hypothetical protein
LVLAGYFVLIELGTPRITLFIAVNPTDRNRRLLASDHPHRLASKLLVDVWRRSIQDPGAAPCPAVVTLSAAALSAAGRPLSLS